MTNLTLTAIKMEAILDWFCNSKSHRRGDKWEFLCKKKLKDMQRLFIRISESNSVFRIRIFSETLNQIRITAKSALSLGKIWLNYRQCIFLDLHHLLPLRYVKESHSSAVPSGVFSHCLHHAPLPCSYILRQLLFSFCIKSENRKCLQKWYCVASVRCFGESGPSRYNYIG